MKIIFCLEAVSLIISLAKSKIVISIGGRVSLYCSRAFNALFNSDEELVEFTKRHNTHKLDETDISTYSGNAYLGIDAGSTTTKLVLLSEDNKILYYYYSHNKGTPVDIVNKALKEMYQLKNDQTIIKSAYSTGYGEELIKHAYNLDGSEVETICHYKAASYFNPDVDFIIDIGGQDMKCFKIVWLSIK